MAPQEPRPQALPSAPAARSMTHSSPDPGPRRNTGRRRLISRSAACVSPPKALWKHGEADASNESDASDPAPSARSEVDRSGPVKQRERGEREEEGSGEAAVQTPAAQGVADAPRADGRERGRPDRAADRRRDIEERAGDQGGSRELPDEQGGQTLVDPIERCNGGVHVPCRLLVESHEDARCRRTSANSVTPMKRASAGSST